MHELFLAHGGGRVASLQPACNVLTEIGQSHGPLAGPGHEAGSELFGISENIPQASQTAHRGLHSGTGGGRGERKLSTLPDCNNH